MAGSSTYLGNLVSMASHPPASFNYSDKALPRPFVRGIMLQAAAHAEASWHA